MLIVKTFAGSQTPLHLAAKGRNLNTVSVCLHYIRYCYYYGIPPIQHVTDLKCTCD